MGRYCFMIALLLFTAAMQISCTDEEPAFVTPTGVTRNAVVEIISSSSDYRWWLNGTAVSYATDAGEASEGEVSMIDWPSASAVLAVDEAAGSVWCFRCGYAPQSFSGTLTFSVLAVQDKTDAGTAEEDMHDRMLFFSTAGKLSGKSASVNLMPVTAGLKIMIYDSGYSSVGETVRKVTFTADGDEILTGNIEADLLTGKTGVVADGGSVVEAATDGVLTVGHGTENASGVGIVIFPQASLAGKISVETDRGVYEFAVDVPSGLSAGTVEEILLDMSEPLVHPLRRVGILGDSISTFSGYIASGYGPYYPKGDVSTVKDTYWYKLIYDKMPHATLDVNSSYAGTRVTTDPKYPGYDFVSRCLDFKDPDVIIIHGGTNDSNNGVILGSYDYDSDIESLNPDYFRQAYIKLIRIIRDKYEGANIICVIGDRLGSGYASSIMEIAGHFGLPCVNFQNDGENIPKVSGSHPTAAGFDYMAGKIYSEAEEYLQ